VDEPERLVGTQDLRLGQPIRGLGDPRLIEAGELGDDGQPGVLAQHRHGPRHLDRLVAHAGKAQQHGARYRPRPDLAHQVSVARVGRHPVGGQGRHQLAEQERVAARGLVAGGAEGGFGAASEPLAHEIAHALLRQRAGPQPLGGGVSDELSQQGGVGSRLAGAQGHGEQDRRALEAPGEVGEEAQRRAVAPVDVVDGQEQGPARGQVQGDPVEAVQSGERPVSPLPRVGLPEHRAGAPRGALEDRLVLRRGGLEELAHHAEGEVALQIAAPGGQHAQRAFGRAAQPGEQPALADSGRALDDEQAPVAAPGRLDEGVQGRQLVLALQQFGLMHGSAC
jgi:hypothetical protein